MPHQDFFTDSRPDDNRTKISHLTMYRGDTMSFKLYLKSNGCPINITGGYFWFTVKDDINDPDSSAILIKETGSGIITLNGPLGQLLVAVDPIDTDSLNIEEATTYYWDLQYQDNTGIVQTIFIGKLTILLDVTRNAGFNIGGFSVVITADTTSSGFTAGINPIQEGGFFLNEKQQVSISGATGGTFTITAEDPSNPGNFETTGALNWDETAANIETALETDISFFDDVTMTGAASLDLGPVGITFSGVGVQFTPISLMVMDISLLV